MMRKITAKTVIAFLIIVNISAVEGSDIKELLSECLDIYNKCEKISSERDSATEDLDKRLQAVSLRIILLKQPVYDEEKIRRCNENITFYKNEIAKNKAYIEISQITDPNERAKLAQKYEQERERILKEELEANKPFDKRIDELKEKVKNEQATFEDAMKKYCLLPRSKYPAVAVVATAQYHNGRITYQWMDPNNKQFCSARINLKNKPLILDDAPMLDDKFYISSYFPNSIKVWAGHFLVNFAMAETDWWGREKIAGYVKDFVDLEGLAKIDPFKSDNSLDALAAGSLACTKRYRIIADEKREVVQPLTAERVKVKQLKSRLLKPPADSEQLQKDKDMIEYYTNEMKRSQEYFHIGTITDVNERAAMLSNLEAEKQKLNAGKKKIAGPYDDKIRELTSGLRARNSLLNDAIKPYFLKGTDAYKDVNEITARARFTRATINCIWKDSNGNKLCSARLRLRNRPVIPEDARMLDGVYYISDGGSSYNFIWVWAGNFLVYFDVNRKEWQEKEEIGEIIKTFIDLPGLAKLLH